MAVPRHTDLPAAPSSASDDDPQWLFAALLGEAPPQTPIPSTPAAPAERLTVEIIERLSDPCCIVDEDHFAVVNDAFCSLVGRQRTELLLSGSFAALIQGIEPGEHQGPAVIATQSGTMEAEVIARALGGRRRLVV